MKAQLPQLFAEKFGLSDPQQLQTYFCPGRVNLLGEHIDYNGGWVLPAAISMGIYAVVRPRNDNQIHLASTLFDQKAIINVDQPMAYQSEDVWANYPKGVLAELQKQGITLKGCELLFVNDLPLGSGLSSSAALEVLTLFVFWTLAEKQTDDVTRVQLAQWAQVAENNFIGVQCGIMDMFAVALGKQNQAIQLHCDTLQYQTIPLHLGDYQLVIINTNKPRNLVASKYNERQQECQQAFELINAQESIPNLSKATLDQIDQYIADEVIARRAKHVVTENQRVKEAVICLQNQDTQAFGTLMDASHASLKNDYEVSGLELDTVVSIAQKQPGCIGARMTGAGFGGCALALVHRNELEQFQAGVIKGYEQTIGYLPTCYLVEIGEGVRQL